MAYDQTEFLLTQPLQSTLSENLARIRKIAEGSSDLLVNEFLLSGLPAALLCCEGMLSTAMITELILNPITQIQLPNPNGMQVLDFIQNRQLYSIDRAEADTYAKLFRFLNSGFAVLVVDGAAKALAQSAFATHGVGCSSWHQSHIPIAIHQPVLRHHVLRLCQRLSHTSC